MKVYLFRSLMIFFGLVISFSCNSNRSSDNSSSNEQSQGQGLVSESDNYSVNSADSLKIVEYINCGAINVSGNSYFDYDDNGKIYLQNGLLRYTSDESFVFESEDGGDPLMIECGEDNSGGVEANSSQNVEPQRQWVNCRECHGTGVRTCSLCSGKGDRRCGSCHGKGTKYSTSGTGTYTCVDCNGTGTDQCSSCNGTGNKGNCSSCDGRGQVQE
jgi:hypothetical protein